MRTTKWKPGDEVYGIRWRQRLGHRFEEGTPGVLVESFHHNGMLNHKVQVEGRGIRLFRKLKARTQVHRALEEGTMQPWRLDQWNESFQTEKKPPMTQTEITTAVEYLRHNNYPKPEDCPKMDCPKLRPACQLGICQIAAGMCGDF